METQMEIMAHKENEVKSHQLLFHIHTHEKALNSEMVAMMMPRGFQLQK